MLNNWLFDIPFWMHNNLNAIIKIYSTIYLLRAVLFPSVTLEGMPTFLLVTIGPMSLGSIKNRKIAPETAKNCSFSMTIRPLRTVFNFIKLYTSSHKILCSLIGLGNRNIFEAPIFFQIKTSLRITHYIKTEDTVDSYYQRLRVHLNTYWAHFITINNASGKVTCCQ